MGALYLAREGLIDSSRRGVWSLTEKGRGTFLTLEQARSLFLKWVRIDQDARRDRQKTPETETAVAADANGPSILNYRKVVLELILALKPEGFERLAQELLREAGFTQVFVTGKSGDEGIDGLGTLQINPLVSFKVLFQCKRYRSSVTPSHVRDFRGAMAGRADKGIIITTGSFTSEATREATRDGVPPIELIDGEKRIDMLEHLELGLKPVRTFEADEKYFDKFR